MNKAQVTARDLWCLWQEAGPRTALTTLRDIARSQVYLESDEIVLTKDLGTGDPPDTGTIRIETAGTRHLPLLAGFNRRQCNTARTHRFAQGLAEGRRGMLGFRGDDLVGYFWWHDAAFASDGFYLTRFGVQLAEDEMYGYDLFIAPEHRGRGTPIAFVGAVEAELSRQGYRRMYGFVDGRNVPARWLWATSGHEVVMRRRTRRILRRFHLVDDHDPC